MLRSSSTLLLLLLVWVLVLLLLLLVVLLQLQPHLCGPKPSVGPATSASISGRRYSQQQQVGSTV
jgi:hypothetical protein